MHANCLNQNKGFHPLQGCCASLMVKVLLKGLANLQVNTCVPHLDTD